MQKYLENLIFKNQFKTWLRNLKNQNNLFHAQIVTKPF